MNRLLKKLKSKIYFDQYLFISITILSIMGLLFLYSASQGNVETIVKQSLFVVFGSTFTGYASIRIGLRLSTPETA